jgi:hypothetical protein
MCWRTATPCRPNSPKRSRWPPTRRRPTTRSRAPASAWLTLLVNGLVLVGFTLLGGLQGLSVELLKLTGPGMVLPDRPAGAFAVVSGLLDLPFDYYKQFGLEQRFGFNKMSAACSSPT